jgi:hypothetical protein
MKRLSFLIIPFLLAILNTLPLSGTEQILSFDSHITVDSSGSMDVTEKITVISEGDRIKHGIYRDFPTKYKDRYGNHYVVDFQLTDIRCDGLSSNYWTEPMRNGIRVYIGEKKALIPTGRHIYLIRYQTTRQLGFFNGYDELYWNVTGNGWAFPIGNAYATIELPSDAAKHLKWYGGYTGPAQSKENNYIADIRPDGKIHFSAAKQLNENEGLTIYVAWPAGYVTRPDNWTKFNYFLKDNLDILAGLAGNTIVFTYYLLVWAMVGKDPKKGTIIPIYSPPDNLSPAAVRYITKMGFDDRAFAAAIINTAVKGAVEINDMDGVYDITRLEKKDSTLTAEENKLLDTLIGQGTYRSITLQNENHKEIRAAMRYLINSLKTAYEKIYFNTNSNYFYGGFIISAIAMLGCAFSLPQLNVSPSPMFVLLFITIVLINLLFYHLLKAPTLLGRRVLDRIEGFKMYLTVAEKDRLSVLVPPDKSVKTFEKYLPYALALDVEQQWSEYFSEVLAAAGAGGAETDEGGQTDNLYSHHYSPRWYHSNRHNTFTGTNFTSSLSNAFAGAISSSSTPPGSTGGRGGFSGGGGGGGGGGGW